MFAGLIRPMTDLTSDELVDTIAQLGGGSRIVTGTALRAALRASGTAIGTEVSSYRIKDPEEIELAAVSSRIVKWKHSNGRSVGFTLPDATGPFEGWVRHT